MAQDARLQTIKHALDTHKRNAEHVTDLGKRVSFLPKPQALTFGLRLTAGFNRVT